MFKQNKSWGAETRPSSQPIFRLPKLSEVKPAPVKGVCLNCRKPKPRFDDAPLKDSGLCRDCIALWQRLDDIICGYSDNKILEFKRKSMLEKWGNLLNEK